MAAKKRLTAASSKSASSAASASTTPAAPLPRGPHTAQLIFHLAVHATLILLASLILPAHLLSRKHESTSNLSLQQSVHLLFSLPATQDNVLLLRKIMWGVVQAVGLVQAWALIRFKKWFDLGIAIENGDSNAAREATKRGWAKGAELLTLTSVSLLVALLIFHVLLILFGAPLLSDTKSTLCLSLALSLIIAFPLQHIAPALFSYPLYTSPSSSPSSVPPTADSTTTTTTTTTTSRSSTRHLYNLLWTTFLIPLVASLLGGAPLTFDHGKAWLIWPIPPILALFFGVVVADLVGGAVYLLSF